MELLSWLRARFPPFFLTLLFGFAVILNLWALAQEAPPGVHGDQKVVLLVVDSADWRLIGELVAQGKLPTFERFMREGSSGPLSVPTLWSTPNIATIVTGTNPKRHGLDNHFSLNPTTGSLKKASFDELQAKPLWRLADFKSVLVGFAEAPVTPRGVSGVGSASLFVSVLDHNRVSVPFALRLIAWRDALSFKRLVAQDLADLDGRFVSEGFSAALNSSLSSRFFDAVLTRINSASLEQGYDASNVISSVDAIRSSNVSARVIYEYDALSQSALISSLGTDANLFIAYFAGVDVFGHVYFLEGWQQPDDKAASDQLVRYYQTIDRYVSEILVAAGENATVIVVSDHGHQNVSFDLFEQERLLNMTARIAPHTAPASFLALGPRIKANVTVQNGSLTDVAPTVLTLLGEPTDQFRFDGRVLSDIIRDDKVVR